MEYALGVVVSLIVMGMKRLKETNIWATYVLLALISIVAGYVYVFFSAQEYWPLVVQTILFASAFHNLVLRRIEEYVSEDKGGCRFFVYDSPFSSNLTTEKEVL